MGSRTFSKGSTSRWNAPIRHWILVHIVARGTDTACQWSAHVVWIVGECVPHHCTLLEDLYWTGNERTQLWKSRETIPTFTGENIKYWLVEIVLDVCERNKSGLKYTQVSMKLIIIIVINHKGVPLKSNSIDSMNKLKTVESVALFRIYCIEKIWDWKLWKRRKNKRSPSVSFILWIN